MVEEDNDQRGTRGLTSPRHPPWLPNPLIPPPILFHAATKTNPKILFSERSTRWRHDGPCCVATGLEAMGISFSGTRGMLGGVQGVGPGRQEGHSPIELLSLGTGTQKVLG